MYVDVYLLLARGVGLKGRWRQRGKRRGLHPMGRTKFEVKVKGSRVGVPVELKERAFMV